MNVLKFISALTFLISLTISLPVFSQDECKNEMDAFNKIQVITAGLMYKITDPNIREITDHYGKENKKAEALMKQGKYQEACDIYQAVIDKYGFKTMEQRYNENHPEIQTNNQEASVVESSSSSTAESSSATTSGAATASE